ncbi:unnamed protein product [Closterium sp. NIES-65]|nr:unnamed protein product [Closterium sp. NIES-65]
MAGLAVGGSGVERGDKSVRGVVGLDDDVIGTSNSFQKSPYPPPPSLSYTYQEMWGCEGGGEAEVVGAAQAAGGVGLDAGGIAADAEREAVSSVLSHAAAQRLAAWLSPAALRLSLVALRLSPAALRLSLVAALLALLAQQVDPTRGDSKRREGGLAVAAVAVALMPLVLLLPVASLLLSPVAALLLSSVAALLLSPVAALLLSSVAALLLSPVAVRLSHLSAWLSPVAARLALLAQQVGPTPSSSFPPPSFPPSSFPPSASSSPTSFPLPSFPPSASPSSSSLPSSSSSSPSSSPSALLLHSRSRPWPCRLLPFLLLIPPLSLLRSRPPLLAHSLSHLLSRFPFRPFHLFLSDSVATPPEASGGAPAEPHAGNAQAAKAPYKMPTPEEMAAQEMMNHCGVRTVISGVMGGGMGVMMGLLFGALDQPLHVEEMSTRQQLVHGFKQMAQRSWHTGKTFAVMGAIFSASECMAEKARARHDEVNTVIAGCVTGGALSARGVCVCSLEVSLSTGSDGGDLLGVRVHGGEGEGEARWGQHGRCGLCDWGSTLRQRAPSECMGHQSAWAIRVHGPSECMGHQSAWAIRVHGPSECMAEKARARHDEANTAPQKSSQKAPQKSSQKAPQKSSQKAPQKSSQKAPQKSSQKAPQKSSQKAPQKVTTVIAGCVTGGALSAREGPEAACMGCVLASLPFLFHKACQETHVLLLLPSRPPCTPFSLPFPAAGPQAACMGCAGFAAFSLLIEKVLERYH